MLDLRGHETTELREWMTGPHPRSVSLLEDRLTGTICLRVQQGRWRTDMVFVEAVMASTEDWRHVIATWLNDRRLERQGFIIRRKR